MPEELEQLRQEIQTLNVKLGKAQADLRAIRNQRRSGNPIESPLFQTESRRHAMISRIELAKFFEKEFNRPPWELVPNAAHQAAPTPKVTVLISLFNYAQYIEQCLDSVSSSQAEGIPFEVLIVDDCSTDNSAQVVEAFIKKSNTPMALIKKSLNTGVVDARNIGLQLSRAEHIFVVDADNWIYPDCLKRFYEGLRDSEHSAIYGLMRRFCDSTGDALGHVSMRPWNVAELIERPYIDAMAMFRKDALLSVGGYSTELIYYAWPGWDDYDLWLKFAQKGYTCGYIPDEIAAYRVHDASMLKKTNHYTRNYAKHFRRKFADLAEAHNSGVIFGFALGDLA